MDNDIISNDRTTHKDESGALSDINTFNAFLDIEWRPSGGTEHSLRWLLRDRDRNGLLTSGAVVEKRAPGRNKPKLFIVKSKFKAWMLQSDHNRGAG